MRQAAMQEDNDTILPQQLHSVVYERLRSRILDGRLQPGVWLRQRQIATELGVSQMPVREALKQLAAEGMVEHIPYRGMRVREYSADDVADIYNIRAFMEARAARSAAEHITSEEMAELRALAIQMEACLSPESLAEHRELNRRFHQVIFTASRRTYLIHALGQLWTVFPSMLWGSFRATATERFSEQDAYDTPEHRAIIRVLEERNAARAEQVMCQHITDAGDRLLATLSTGADFALGRQA
jgi:DNA-binding GntR family transcriptional regulator